MRFRETSRGSTQLAELQWGLAEALTKQAMEMALIGKAGFEGQFKNRAR